MINMTKIIKLSRFFLLVSVSTIFLDKIQIMGLLKISNFFLLISFLLFIFYILKEKINIWQEKKLIYPIVLFFGIILISTTYSLITFKNLQILEIIKGLISISVNLFIFIEIIILSKNDNTLPNKILISFLFSLLIIPFIYIPEINKYFLFASSRFEGLLNGPNYFAIFQIIPTLLILFFIMKENSKKIIQITFSILFCLSIGLILWSGSRGGMLGLITSFILLIFLLFYSIPKKKLLGVIFLIIISFPVGFYIIPQKSQQNITARIEKVQIVKSYTLNDNTDNKIPNTKRIVFFTDISSGQDRLNIWKNSLYFIVQNPLGYGYTYNNIINIKGDKTEHRVSHNLELQILLTGGVGLFIIINLFLLNLIIKSLNNCYKQKFNEIHIMLPILTGTLVSSIFLDSLFFRFIWIIMALIITYNRQIDHHKKNEL